MTDKPNVQDFNPYAIDCILEQEIEQFHQEQNRGRRTRWLKLQPGQKEKVVQTNLRPVFFPKNEFGQQQTMYSVYLHEKMDKPVPGGRRKAFPNIKHGHGTVACLNLKKDDDYCHICRVEGEYRRKGYSLTDQAKATDSKKDSILADKYRAWFSGFKRTKFHFFVAIHLLGDVPEGQEKDAGKIAVGKDSQAVTEANPHGLVMVDESEAQYWVDPCAVVKIKDYWSASLFQAINTRVMGKAFYEKQIGKTLTQEEYLRQCPKERPAGPFDAKLGYSMEITVSGKGKDQKWVVRLNPIAELTRAEKVSIFATYPDLMSNFRPYGEEDVEPFAQWMERNPKATVADYAHFRLNRLSEAQFKLLGLDQEDPPDDVDLDDDEDDEEPKKGKKTKRQAAADDDGDDESYTAKGDLSDLDELDDDIPFS